LKPPGSSGAAPNTPEKTLYYLSDALGSALALQTVDGRISARYRYDEFGIPEQPENFDPNWPGTDNLFGNRELGYDYYSGLSFANARYFDPTIGRFISEVTYEGDITNPLTLNLYTYVTNNPLKYIDPTGYWATDVTANWTINEMKWKWQEARDQNDQEKMNYWHNKAEKLRNELRKAGYTDEQIMQSTDAMIPEEIVMDCMDEYI